VLRVPARFASSDPVVCPNCDRRIWLGQDARSEERPPETFWDQVPIDEVLNEMKSGPAPPAGTFIL
jgi:hypothetical protein